MNFCFILDFTLPTLPSSEVFIMQSDELIEFNQLCHTCFVSKLDSFSVIFIMNHKQHLFALCHIVQTLWFHNWHFWLTKEITFLLGNTHIFSGAEKTTELSSHSAGMFLSNTALLINLIVFKMREGALVWAAFQSQSEDEKMFLCPSSPGITLSLLWRCPS